jgi:hypothetical protein
MEGGTPPCRPHPHPQPPRAAPNDPNLNQAASMEAGAAHREAVRPRPPALKRVRNFRTSQAEEFRVLGTVHPDRGLEPARTSSAAQGCPFGDRIGRGAEMLCRSPLRDPRRHPRRVERDTKGAACSELIAARCWRLVQHCCQPLDQPLGLPGNESGTFGYLEGSPRAAVLKHADQPCELVCKRSSVPGFRRFADAISVPACGRGCPGCWRGCWQR